MKYFTQLVLSASAVTAHSLFQDLWTGTTDDAQNCTRMPLSNSPVTNVESNDIRCNVGTKPAADVCSIDAGSSLTVEMHAQPGDRSCTTLAIGGNHFGPVLIYMSKVDDATTADGSSDWFKVAEDGYDPSVGTPSWGTELLNKNCGKRAFTVPKSLPEGNYLVRAEAIALHAAQQEGGAQFYMSCYQVKVSNGGSGSPSPTVKFPGAYQATDPGIKIDIYQTLTNYTIPGPAVWSG